MWCSCSWNHCTLNGFLAPHKWSPVIIHTPLTSVVLVNDWSPSSQYQIMLMGPRQCQAQFDPKQRLAFTLPHPPASLWSGFFNPCRSLQARPPVSMQKVTCGFSLCQRCGTQTKRGFERLSGAQWRELFWSRNVTSVYAPKIRWAEEILIFAWACWDSPSDRCRWVQTGVRLLALAGSCCQQELKRNPEVWVN